MNIDAQAVTKLFLLFLFSKSVIESWLEAKNKGHIIANRNEVPDKFKETITLEEHQKAADYSVTKIKAGKLFHFIDLLVLLGWTLGGGLSMLQNFVATFSLSPIYEGVAYLAIFGLISTLISLPQSIYMTFVIEEKFGFNKMTPALFVKDMFKGLVLGSILGLPLFAALLWVMQSLGNNWWIYGWGLLTGFQFILLWGYPRFIAPLFNKFSPMDEGPHKERVLDLLKRTGFTSNGLFVMDASIRSAHGNAYFTGFGKNKRIVFFDTLLKTLEPGEVEAVLAHELGHFKRKHIVKQLVRSVVMSFAAFFILGQLIQSMTFFSGHGVTTSNLHLSLLLFAMVSGVYTFWVTPLSAWISRKYEFEADSFAAEFAEPRELISALVKLYKDNASTLTPDPTFSAYYHSHPPALIRVQHLEGLSKQ
ncbi:MAG: M48 family metallopeptidase [Bacteriovoracaceae bacterium]|nr:M48 family metallopeptidase [Bacteriovoracaceae bacterium]